MRLKKYQAVFAGVLLATFWGGFGNRVYSATLPTLPQTYIDTTYSAPTGATCTAANSSAFQTCLNNAALNSTIVLQAGTTYTGQFTLPNKTSGSGWIYIVSNNLANLPAAGTRVSPSNAANMPKIVTGVSYNPAIITASNAHHYRFVGIEFSPTVGTYINTIIQIGNNENSISLLPNNFTFDRCYIHGDSTAGSRRGIAMNGSSVAVIDSYISDFKEGGADSQAVWAHNSPGPFKIVNNYLEAAGENVMFGGADAAITNAIPSDIEIKRNYLFKPLSWISQGWVIKNIFELKNAQRVLFEGNVLENSPASAQQGFGVQLTPRNQGGGNPWSTVSDVTIRLNKMINFSQGINILGHDGDYPSDYARRNLIENNIIQVTQLNGGNGRPLQILGGPIDTTFRHNTALITVSGGTMAFTESNPPANQFDYRDNITTFGSYGFTGTSTATGLPTLNAYYTNWTMTNNAIIGPNYSSVYPSGNFWPSNTNAVGFVDYAGGNYRLTSASPYHNAGTDGKDIGADIDAIEAAIAGGSSPVCGDGICNGSETYSTCPADCSAPDSPPTSPTGLGANATSSSSITINWAASTDDHGIANYQVQRCTGLPVACPDASFVQVGTPTTSPFVNNTGLSADTNYSYRVRAVDTIGQLSGWTNVVSARTQAGAPTAPTITVQPQSQSVNVGGTATFSVTASGTTPLSYQWRRNGTNISGATNSSYTTSTLTLSDNGSAYSVVVTNSVGSATSNTATLTVTTAPPVSQNLMAAYNFNENSGTTTSDVSGHNRTGTLTNGPVWAASQTGHGSALSFDGANDFVDAGNTSLGLTNTLTVSAWVRSTADTNGRILSKHGGSGSYGWVLMRSQSNDAFEWRISTNGSDWNGGETAIGSFPINQWIFVSAIYNGSAMRVYINGVESTGTGLPASVTGAVNNSAGSLQIGRDAGMGDQYAFTGSIDDVRIYNIALTQAEIQTDMNTPVSAPSSFSACNTVTASNFSQAAYNNYGAPYDLFASNAQLVDAKCTASDPTKISATIGKTGDTTRIVYTKGYYFDPGINNWAPYTSTCTGTLNGDWCAGPTTATITDPDLSTASAGTPAYFVGMVCSVQGGGWKCGCRDTSCTNFYWQIQGAGL